jgi:hypothetical protein
LEDITSEGPRGGVETTDTIGRHKGPGAISSHIGSQGN